jgi:hypothetical protein
VTILAGVGLTPDRDLYQMRVPLPIAERPRDVSGFEVGAVVASGAGISCGECFQCRAGLTNLCLRTLRRRRMTGALRAAPFEPLRDAEEPDDGCGFRPVAKRRGADLTARLF